MATRRSFQDRVNAARQRRLAARERLKAVREQRRLAAKAASKNRMSQRVEQPATSRQLNVRQTIEDRINAARQRRLADKAASKNQMVQRAQQNPSATPTPTGRGRQRQSIVGQMPSNKAVAGKSSSQQERQKLESLAAQANKRANQLFSQRSSNQAALPKGYSLVQATPAPGVARKAAAAQPQRAVRSSMPQDAQQRQMIENLARANQLQQSTPRPKQQSSNKQQAQKTQASLNQLGQMAKGGSVKNKGNYAKGGVVKANCGASMKPAHQKGKK